MAAAARIAFVNIGTSPRKDIVPEMVDDILNGNPISSLEVEEFGVLDGLSAADLDAILAKDGEPCFVTNSADRGQVVISIKRTEQRLNAILQKIDSLGFDMIVLLCTGTQIDPLKNTIVVEAQKVVDNAIEAFTLPENGLGILLPIDEQIAGFETRHPCAAGAKLAAASPYNGQALAPKAKALSQCKVIVMHCMGYTREMRNELRSNLSGHVLHARGLVSAHVRQFL